MIVTEIYGAYSGGGNLIRTYSDAGYRIMQTDTGVVYDEAIDPEIVGRSYTETDDLIPVDDTDLTEKEILDILLGDEGVEA